MADVNVSSYQPLQAPQQQQMGPLQVLQLIGQLNQNKLFQQEFDARQNIGNAYRDNTLPNGEFNMPGLRTQIGQTGGFHAGEGLAQATSNSAADTTLKSTYQQILRSTFGALASKPVITDADISAAKADAARQGVPGTFIQDYLVDMPQAKKRKEWAVTQSNLSRSPETVAAGTEGPIDETGARPQISGGEAAYRRAGAVPAPPGAPPAAPGAPALPPPQIGMPTQLPVGAATTMELGGKMKAESLARAASYGADIYPMEQLLTNLQALGPKKVGPGTQEINTLKSFVQSNLSWLPGADKIIGDPNDIAKYEEAQKYATQLAGSRASMFGHGTDQAMATALVGSPNTHISQLGSVDLTKAIIALKRMEQTQALEGASQPEHKYLKWAGDWATTVDPRAFMADKMTKEQLDAVEKSLKTPEQRKRYNMSVDRAIKAGVMEAP